MNTNDTNPPEEKIFFTPRHIIRKNHLGHPGEDETFYLNNDFAESASVNILHCFAFGVSRWGEEWSIDKEFDRYISFNFFLEGGIILQSARSTLQAKAGDLVIARRTPVTLRTPPGGMAVKYCLLLSSNATQNAICDQIAPHDPAVLTMRDPEKITALLENIYKLIKNGSSRKELDTAIFTFLREVQQQQQRKPSTSALLDKALYILRQKNFRLSRSELAQECKVDPRTLTRLFVRHLDTPPGQYIIRCRLEKAAQMLCLSDEPVKKIADECGFSTPMFFAREFRQHFACTPTEYRKKGRSVLPE